MRMRALGRRKLRQYSRAYGIRFTQGSVHEPAGDRVDLLGEDERWYVCRPWGACVWDGRYWWGAEEDREREISAMQKEKP